MAFTSEEFGAVVLVGGGALVKPDTYIGDASTTWAKGDLCRINTVGAIVDAATDSDTTGPCHGMLLETHATAPAATTKVKILQFTSETILALQIYAASGSDAEQQDIVVGATYTLRNCSAGIWGVTTTTTKGIALCVGKSCDSKWFDDNFVASADFGVAYYRFTAANIDGRGA